MRTTNILIVEDEMKLRKGLSMFLQNEGYIVFEAEDGLEALKTLEKEKIDLIITDVLMPNMNGFELTEQVRKLYPNILIIVLTALDDESSELKSFELQANDYIPKPYKIRVLMARVKSLLGSKINKDNPVHDFHDAVYDAKNRILKDKTSSYILTEKEGSVLSLLLENRGNVVSRNDILKKVWTEGEDERRVDVVIKNIRSKVGPYAQHITTVRNGGYIVQ